jgi:exodeoxyribonuclease VIII
MNNKRETLSSFILIDEPAEYTTSARLVDMPDDEYHRHDSLSKTKLAEFVKSPLTYKARYIDRVMPERMASKQMELGSIVHAVLLEGKLLTDLIAVIPDECLSANGSINSRGSAYREFCEREAGKYFVKERQLEPIRQCLESVERSPLAEVLGQSTQRERAVFWTDAITGLECRCKPDFFIELDDAVVCYDLKVSPMVTMDSFRRQIKSFTYWLQDAHYSQGLMQLTGKPVQFRFWVVEPVAPFRVGCYWLEENITRVEAQQRWRKSVDDFALAKESGEYVENLQGAVVLNQWDFGGEVESELEVNWDE